MTPVRAPARLLLHLEHERQIAVIRIAHRDTRFARRLPGKGGRAGPVGLGALEDENREFGVTGTPGHVRLTELDVARSDVTEFVVGVPPGIPRLAVVHGAEAGGDELDRIRGVIGERQVVPTGVLAGQDPLGHGPAEIPAADVGLHHAQDQGVRVRGHRLRDDVAADAGLHLGLEVRRRCGRRGDVGLLAAAVDHESDDQDGQNGTDGTSHVHSLQNDDPPQKRC